MICSMPCIRPTGLRKILGFLQKIEVSHNALVILTPITRWAMAKEYIGS